MVSGHTKKTIKNMKKLAAEVSHETMNRVLQTRNEILIDLHLYYRSKGFSDTAVTLKTANLFMLIPKIEVNLLFSRITMTENLEHGPTTQREFQHCRAF